MAFHLALYDASIANGAVLLQVAALADPVIAPAGNGLLVHQLVPKLARVVAVGTNLTRVQLSSGSIRRYTPLDIAPVNVGTVIESPARMWNQLDSPVDLAVNEELDAFGVQSNAGAQRIRIAVYFCDGPFKVLSAKGFSVHFTNTITLVVNAFTAFTPTFDNGLPAGTFIVVGARVLSAGGLFYRLIPRGGSPLRPGGMMVQAQDGYADASERNGDMGEWMRFTNTTPPQIECFSGSADTSVEGYLDLVQVA
jgi:hypothetical protein